jgi:type VI protein secretion system component Hcp
MYMKIDGVNGEASEFKYKGWSKIISWNWGMTSNRKTVKAGEDAKTMLSELSVIKPIGIDSTEIRNLYALGDVIPQIVLNITPVVGKRDTQTNYVDIIMEDVIIKSVVTGGGPDDKFFKEHLTFIFDRVSFECNRPVNSEAEQAADIAAPGNDFRWDVMGNKKWVN